MILFKFKRYNNPKKMIQKPLENNTASDPKERELGDEKKIQQIESIPLMIIILTL